MIVTEILEAARESARTHARAARARVTPRGAGAAPIENESPMTPDRTSPSESRQVEDENIRTVAARTTGGRTPHDRTTRRRSCGGSASRDSTVVWHAAWFAIWIAANVRFFPIEPFDPFPFSLLAILVGLEAIFLTLFLLASQNRLTQEENRRAHLDLQVNLLAEQEMTLVLQMLKEILRAPGAARHDSVAQVRRARQGHRRQPAGREPGADAESGPAGTASSRRPLIAGPGRAMLLSVT